MGTGCLSQSWKYSAKIVNASPPPPNYCSEVSILQFQLCVLYAEILYSSKGQCLGLAQDSALSQLLYRLSFKRLYNSML